MPHDIIFGFSAYLEIEIFLIIHDAGSAEMPENPVSTTLETECPLIKLIAQEQSAAFHSGKPRQPAEHHIGRRFHRQAAIGQACPLRVIRQPERCGAGCCGISAVRLRLRSPDKSIEIFFVRTKNRSPANKPAGAESHFQHVCAAQANRIDAYEVQISLLFVIDVVVCLISLPLVDRASIPEKYSFSFSLLPSFCESFKVSSK